MKLRPLTTVFALLLGCGVGLQAQTYVWTGLGSTSFYDGYYDGANWQGGVGPALFEGNPGNDTIIFGNARQTLVRYDAIKAHQLQFTGHTRPYKLEAFGGATIYLGAGGIVYSPVGDVRSKIDDSIVLTANQTWNITGGGLSIQGAIYEDETSRTLTKTGAGTLVLEPGYYDDSTFSGGFVIRDGRVVVQSKVNLDHETVMPVSSLGSGTLTFDASGGGTPTLVAGRFDYYGDYSFEAIVENPIAIIGAMRTENHTQLFLTGPVALQSSAVISTVGRPLFIEGGISGSGKSLTINAAGLVVLDAGATESANTYDGGTHVQNGLLIFGSEDAIPETGAITVANTGYAGLAAPGYGTSNFIAKFTPAATHGTIGFDTDPYDSTNVFEGAIDLTGFSATARLGSATHAAIGSDSTITPQGADYRFGGGGGYLSVGAHLGDAPNESARNLVGASPSALPLTVYLGHGGNDFSGFVRAAHTAFIFGSSSLPAAATLELQQGGYIGQEDVADPQAFIDRFPTDTAHGMIGFNGGTISAALDLSNFTGPVYLGTTEQGGFDGPPYGGLRLTGTITTGNDGTDPYRFGAYKGAMLRVESILSGSAGVHVGDPYSPATFGDYLNEQMSVVALMGDNSSLTGNVTLFAGELFLGHANALGTGDLVVNSMTLPVEWQFEDGHPPAPVLSTYGSMTLANDIVLNSRLDVSDYASFELTGQLSGSGQLYLREDASVSIANNNPGFSGGVYISSYSDLYVGADQATGTGPLAFGGGNNSYVYFETANPVIGGLVSGPGDYSYLDAEVPDTILTINQSLDSTFSGAFYSNDYDERFRIVKAGSGTLRLNNGGYHAYGVANADLGGTSIGLQVNAGTLVISNDFCVQGDSTIWVHGGTLAVENRHLGNDLVVDNGGRLAGHGSFDTVAIGTGAVLSPGLPGKDEIGSLGFHHLELDPGGTLEWHIQNPTGAPGEGFDHINIFNHAETLVINATSGDPFSLKIISLNTGGSAGLLAGLTPGESYSWTVFSFDALSGGFDPAKFALDLSLFQTALGDGLAAGDFSLSLAGDNLMLNFTAVPEPSTYALMALGLAFVGWSVWRRRRA
ncbi:MAG: PEP-CTERM sorting domain-containing protein [Opitutaceae bacterium]|nr:PEP-CTERM sorting domain-containing protein [Opitutaceae bacterium]